MDTGQTALLTNLTETPSSITWSPDSEWIAFVMQVEAILEPFAKPLKKPENAEWAEPVKVIDRLVYRIDGMGYLKTGYSHIFLVSAEGGTPRQLTTGDFNHRGPLSWTPDSKHILFSANRNKDWEYDDVNTEIFKLGIEEAERWHGAEGIKAWSDALGSWLTLSKPPLKGVDEWRHWEHGPDNNPVSTDQVIRAPYLTQFLAGPRAIAMPAITTVAGGRTFLATGHIAHHRREWELINKLIARNGYNGVILWQRDLPKGFLAHSSAFVATRDAASR